MDNHDVVFNLLDEIEKVRRRRMHEASKSKFKIGQLVRVTEDKGELVRYLRPLHKNYMHAIMEADTLRGRVMKLIMVEELTDRDGTKDRYASLEGSSGLMYLLPESMIRDYRER